MYRKSFGEAGEILIQHFPSSIENLYMIDKSKLIYAKKRTSELIIYENCITLTKIDKYIVSHSNKMLNGLVYLQQFDEIKTLIFSFEISTKEKQQTFINPTMKGDCKLYKIENSGLNYHANRGYSLEHAAISNNYSHVTGLSDDADIFQFTFQSESKSLSICTVRKCDFLLTIRQFQFDFPSPLIFDFFMKFILFVDARDKKPFLYLYTISKLI